ncbi:zinc-ribbon domain-containing protein [Arthrobacter sp. zg-Y1110]|uniref:zinc-ribbon domain-containing protein n=1 Tax=Arthrobacter sp. zg-Y1110 TaxID=2886932 RepID=UPI001D13A096|nr:zinc-ribbon domain-containing protein [Arthrobacter sp. zg-Y1110]MCC3292838.1 zinc-ribbon domain-containing protein [Arthrobacter sp. zg-Y1110]UWX86777.1 zinc-ribbon domain-containing protein [Arthrobacter sp. zg-Y1110]
MEQTAVRRRPHRPALSQVNPALAAEWDYARNGDLKPSDVTPSSLNKAWWVCSNGHPSFFSRIANRNAGSGCPACGRSRTTIACKTPVPGQSLADLRPDLAAEWDAEANAGLQANGVYLGSSRIVSWLCPEGHGSYIAKPSSRTGAAKRGCPVCAERSRLDGRSVPAPGRSLAELRPDLAAQWDAEANAPRTPADVALQSKRVYSWLCPQGHDPYRMRVVDRYHSNGCPVCLPSSADRIVTG